MLEEKIKTQENKIYPDRDYIIEHMYDALKNGWIKAYFQPLVRTLTEEVCGAETLARWEDPVYGTISPALFIPIYEKTNEIYKIDLLMVEEACKALKYRMENGLHVYPLSVNFSRLDFIKIDVVSNVKKIVEKYNIDPALIDIEITESVLSFEGEDFKKIIQRFHDNGHKVWMDDFGSGYSSLNVLNDYDFDLLKIDMKFISNKSQRSQIILRSIIDMAKNIGIVTLAEGVETKEDVELLKQFGCEVLQGYYYSRPQSNEDLRLFLKKQGRKVEKTHLKKYWKEVGKVNLFSFNSVELNTDNNRIKSQVPLALIQMNIEDNSLQCYYVNNEYNEEMKRIDLDNLDVFLENTNETDNAVKEIIINQILEAEKSNRTISKDYILFDKYCHLTIRIVAEMQDRIMCLASFLSLKEQDTADRIEHVIAGSKYALSVFKIIGVICPGNDSSQTIYSAAAFDHDYGKVSLIAGINEFTETMIFIDDKERYKAFMDMDSLEKRMKEKNQTFISSPFRIKHDDTYETVLIRISKVIEKGVKKYIYSMLSADNDVIYDFDKMNMSFLK